MLIVQWVIELCGYLTTIRQHFTIDNVCHTDHQTYYIKFGGNILHIDELEYIVRSFDETYVL